MTTFWWLWLVFLLLAAGLVGHSLCVVSARADAQAERAIREWQARKANNDTRKQEEHA